MTDQRMIPPGSTIAVLGDGQLGKMLVQAGQRLGFEMLVVGTSGSAPAMHCTSRGVVVPKYTFTEVLKVVPGVSVITTEWENIPESLMTGLASAGHLVRPSAAILGIAQSRDSEKKFAKRIGAQPVPSLYIPDAKSGEKADTRGLFPGVLKANTNGYDGKHQFPIDDQSDLEAVLKRAGVPCVLERRMLLDFECSILVARAASGEVSLSDVVVNDHHNGILAQTSWKPGLVQDNIVSQAEEVARSAAQALNLVGILVIEFFVSDGKLFFNEMAPRPHNSFHASIEAARTSQFEQHIRAICGLPLGEVRFHTPFRMINLIGNEWIQWPRHIRSGNVHLYGKSETNPGRKMGHVTFLAD